MLPQQYFEVDRHLWGVTDSLLALHAFIGLGEKGGVSLYPKKAPFTVFSFYSKNVQNTVYFSLRLWMETCFIIALWNGYVLWEWAGCHGWLWERMVFEEAASALLFHF